MAMGLKAIISKWLPYEPLFPEKEEDLRDFVGPKAIPFPSKDAGVGGGFVGAGGGTVGVEAGAVGGLGVGGTGVGGGTGGIVGAATRGPSPPPPSPPVIATSVS